jgi:hypothetical protein
MRKIFRISALLLLLSAPCIAAEWQQLGGQGMMKFVLVSKSKESEEATYREAIRSLCGASGYCYISFWSERALVPKRLPMTDAQVDAQTASYTRNPATGYEELLWSCRLRSDPKKCFG